jgi:hypothetical protein
MRRPPLNCARPQALALHARWESPHQPDSTRRGIAAVVVACPLLLNNMWGLLPAKLKIRALTLTRQLCGAITPQCCLSQQAELDPTSTEVADTSLRWVPSKQCALR